MSAHACPARGCGEVVPFDVLACKRHWFALPLPLRRMISRHWRTGDLERWAEARAEAVRLLGAA